MTEASERCQGLGAQLWALRRNGVFLIALAAFLFSLGTLAVRFLEPAVPALQVACVPSAFCLVLTGALMITQKTRFLPPSRTVRLLTILRGLFGAASILLYYIAIEMLPLKDAVTLFFCSPVIAVLLEFMVTGDSINSASMVGCLFTVAGVFLVTQPNGMDHMVPHAGMSLGMLVALLAATCNAIAFVIVRALGGRQSALALTWWFHLVVFVVTSIPLSLKYPAPPVWVTRQQALLLVGVITAQLCGQILLNRGFQLLSATRGSAVNVLQVLFSYVWELTVLKESTNAVSLAGGACVMAGVLVVALYGATPAPAQELPPAGSPSDMADPDLTYILVPTGDGGRPSLHKLTHSEAVALAPAHPRTPHAVHPAPVVALAVATGGMLHADEASQPLLQPRQSHEEGGGHVQDGRAGQLRHVTAVRGADGTTAARGPDGTLPPRQSFDVAVLTGTQHLAAD